MFMGTSEKRASGTGKGCMAAAGLLDGLALWHCVQFLHHCTTSAASRGHTKRLLISRLEAQMPGWATLCTASKIARQ
jgi:hypothetical protein